MTAPGSRRADARQFDGDWLGRIDWIGRNARQFCDYWIDWLARQFGGYWIDRLD